MGVVVQFTALGVIVVVGVCILCAIVAMHKIYNEQRSGFLSAIKAVEELRKLQPEFLSVLHRVESDSHALQAIALQIEVSVAGLKHGVSASLFGAAERHTNALEELREHLESQEQRLVKILDNFSRPAPAEVDKTNAANGNGNGNGHGNGTGGSSGHGSGSNGSYVRLRKEVISHDPQIRFSVLKDWLNTNMLAILHRASRGCSSASELIATIPAHLEAEAVLTPERVLLINTRGCAEKVAVPLNPADPMDHEVVSRRTDV